MANGNTATDTADKTEASAANYFGYTPEEIAIEQGDKQATSREDFQAQVNKLVKETTVGEDGKFIYPEGTTDWQKVAIANEKKFRDTQAGFTKGQQELRTLKAENEALKGQVAKGSAPRLSDEQYEELDELKETDVDAYFEKRTEYEQAAITSAREELDTSITEARTQTEAETELERRTNYLAEFNEGREHPITQSVVENEVPSKFFAQLEAGEATFEEFIDNVAGFVDTPKTANGEPTIKNVKNLSDAAGGTTPAESTRFDSLAEEYSEMVF